MGGREVQVESRKSYESQPARDIAERKRVKRESCDAEDHWHVGLCSDKWEIEELGPKVWSESLYIFVRSTGNRVI